MEIGHCSSHGGLLEYTCFFALIPFRDIAQINDRFKVCNIVLEVTIQEPTKHGLTKRRELAWFTLDKVPTSTTKLTVGRSKKF